MSRYIVQWKNIQPDEDIYGNITDGIYGGECEAKNEAEACTHYYTIGVNHIISCVKICEVPTYMTKG